MDLTDATNVAKLASSLTKVLASPTELDSSTQNTAIALLSGLIPDDSDSETAVSLPLSVYTSVVTSLGSVSQASSAMSLATASTNTSDSNSTNSTGSARRLLATAPTVSSFSSARRLLAAHHSTSVALQFAEHWIAWSSRRLLATSASSQGCSKYGFASNQYAGLTSGNQQSKYNVTTGIMNCMCRIGKGTISSAVVGEDAKTITTESIKSSSERSAPESLLSKTITSPTLSTSDATKSQVTLPQQSLFASVPETVDTFQAQYATNPYAWAGTAGYSVVPNVTSFDVVGYEVYTLPTPIMVSWALNPDQYKDYVAGDNSITCIWFDNARSTWKGSGCFLASLTASSATCACYHLTDFTTGSSKPVIPTPTVADPVGDAGLLTEKEAHYLFAGLIFVALVLLFLIITSMLAARYRRAVAEELKATATKYKMDGEVKDEQAGEEKIDQERDTKPGANTKTEATGPPSLWEYLVNEHSVIGIFGSHHQVEYGPVRRITTFLCQITTGFFASAIWLQSGQASIVTTTLASVFATLSSAPIYKTIQWLFQEISRISSGVNTAPAHIQAQFASKLRIVSMCLYTLCYLLIGFNTFSCVLVTANFEPQESWAWLNSNLASVLSSALLLEPAIIYVYWLYEVKYANIMEEEDIISNADVHVNQAGPQLGGLGLRFAASAMKDGVQQHAPNEMQEPEEPGPPSAPEIQPQFIRPSTPVRVETPRRPQTPMEVMLDRVPMLALEQMPEAETPEMTPAPPTPPPAAVAMQEIQRMREELKARADRSRLQVQAQAAQQHARAGTTGTANIAGRAGLPALAALRPLRPAAEAVIASDRLSGLMAQRRDNPTRADRLQRLALSPFARNSSALTGTASRAGAGTLAPLASLNGPPQDGNTHEVSPSAAAAPGFPPRGLGRALPPLQAVPRSSPRRFSSPRSKAQPKADGQ